MRSDALRLKNRVLLTENSDGCKLLPSQNSSLAANWENIPETALLNGSIGVILFILFIIMTKIAWRRAESEDKLVSQNLITFLYGYRDPERWYVIPRFEFLPHEDRHHQHDLQYPNIYVPPKLPLANPIEVFVYDSDTDNTRSVESPHGRLRKKSLVKSIKKTATTKDQGPLEPNITSKTIKTIDSTRAGSTIKSTKTVLNNSPNLRSLINNSQPSTNKTTAKKNDSRLSPLNQSFFYPSILAAEQLQASYLSRKLNRIFSSFFRATDADIIYAKGIDAYEYLLFQRHLILIMFLTNLLCLGIILPIHWLTGTSADPNIVYTTSFQRSTIKNMNSVSHYYWAHIICSSAIVICAIFIMNSYRESIITRTDPQISRRTLLIGNIPSEQRNRHQLLQVIQEYFPGVSVEAIQFVYDTALLSVYEQYLSSILVAKDYCESYKRKYNQELMIHQTDVNKKRVCNGNCRFCSFVLICCCYWPLEPKEPGTIYYAKQEQNYRELITKSCEQLVNEPTEYAFVTFKSHRQARKVMQDLANFKQDALDDKSPTLKPRVRSRQINLGSIDSGSGVKTTDVSKIGESDSRMINSVKSNDPLDPKNNPHVRSIRDPVPVKKPVNTDADKRTSEDGKGSGRNGLENQIQKFEGPITWSIRYAPHPDNVKFSDLLGLSKTSKYTIALLHLLMIIIFIFITTPNVVLSMIERVSVLQPDRVKQLTGFQALIINYFSILLQIITTALLPALVTQISRQIPYEDASSKDHSVMWKVYLFLVLMIIIMPSIGMSSAQSLLSTDIDPKCLFPTDNGAYFINYVISSIFLSTMLELIKPIDILSYYFILWTSRSTAEIEAGRQFIEREFSVGLQHTSVLLIFSVVMTYAISCPLIAPVGLIYLIVKHSVDHYHLYYTYFTRKVDRNLQGTIIIFVKVALLLMLFQTTVAISINTGTSYFSLLSQIVFWITLAAFIFNCFFNFTLRAMPPPLKRSRFQQEFCACFYLPRVFENLLRSDAIPSNCISRKV